MQQPHLWTLWTLFLANNLVQSTLQEKSTRNFKKLQKLRKPFPDDEPVQMRDPL